MPIAIPAGVVKEKKKANIATPRDLNFAYKNEHVKTKLLTSITNEIWSHIVHLIVHRWILSQKDFSITYVYTHIVNSVKKKKNREF